MHCSRLLPPALSSGSIEDKEEIPETTEFTLSPLDDAPLAIPEPIPEDAEHDPVESTQNRS